VSPIADLPRTAPPREGKTTEGPQATEPRLAEVVDLVAYRRAATRPRPSPDAA